ncbi:MAG TPA: MFS transporter [Pirellulales bacterium]|nr:MFS transporter [Pirellulales bacterium]
MSTNSTPSGNSLSAAKHDPYAALRERDFRLFLSGNFLWVLGFKAQTVAVGYEIFQRTGASLALGFVGLVQILPVLALALIAGHAADRFDRRVIILVTLALTVLASVGLAIVSLSGAHIWVTYVLVSIIGVARGFSQPARASFLPQIVSGDRFPNAITWSTGAFQLAFVLGPALGGILMAISGNGSSPGKADAGSVSGPAIVYVCHAAAAATFFCLLCFIRSRPVTHHGEGLTLASLAAGAKFVWSQKVMLGALTLDLFAVLLGGATALLPIYASDEILDVGKIGLGWMEAAPALGAVLMTFIMAHRPPMGHAGRTMLLSVAGFGVATIVFGFSRWFPLSLAMLFLAGALDNISVVIRHTLVQLLTPDAMRGRVTAINGMFIGASNDLGGFESGVVASVAEHWHRGGAELSVREDVAFGATFSVVVGGIGTLVVVALLYWRATALRNYDRLISPRPDTQDPEEQELTP